jgi:tRNA pseudouridine55 synthase
MTRRADLDNRVFVVDKAVGPTSFDVVAAFRRAAGLRKVGHTGTLDPLASGVLILCTGIATRAVEHFMNLEKEYAFTVRLGVETTTLDTEGEVVREAPCPPFSRSDVAAAAATFVGEYRLVPPRFSAVKRSGRRMYEVAREGGDEDAPARSVTIHDFTVAAVSLPDVHCVVRCSRGTYVRSLARDLGERLGGVPAHVAALSRTRIGAFARDGAFPSERIAARDLEGITGYPLEEALDFLPGVVLSSRSKRSLLYGTLPDGQDVVATIGTLGPCDAVRLLDEDGTLLAVGQRGGEERNRLRLVDSFRLFVDPSDTAGR